MRRVHMHIRCASPTIACGGGGSGGGPPWTSRHLQRRQSAAKFGYKRLSPSLSLLLSRNCSSAQHWKEKALIDCSDEIQMEHGCRNLYLLQEKCYEKVGPSAGDKLKTSQRRGMFKLVFFYQRNDTWKIDSVRATHCENSKNIAIGSENVICCMNKRCSKIYLRDIKFIRSCK